MNKNKKGSEPKNQQVKEASILLKDTIRLLENKFWSLAAISFLSAATPFLGQILYLAPLAMFPSFFSSDSAIIAGALIVLGIAIFCFSTFFQLWSWAALITQTSQDKTSRVLISYKTSLKKFCLFFGQLHFSRHRFLSDLCFL